MTAPLYFLSDAGKAALKGRESLELETYLDTKGILTIGLGHTSAAGPPKVVQGMTISEDEAWRIFEADLVRFRNEVRPKFKATVTLAQHEFDAIVSFVFNIGSTQFNSSTFLKRLNAGDHPGAAEAMLWWNKPPEVMTRRYGEYWEFKRGLYFPRADAEGNPVN